MIKKKALLDPFEEKVFFQSASPFLIFEILPT